MFNLLKPSCYIWLFPKPLLFILNALFAINCPSLFTMLKKRSTTLQNSLQMLFFKLKSSLALKISKLLAKRRQKTLFHQLLFQRRWKNQQIQTLWRFYDRVTLSSLIQRQRTYVQSWALSVFLTFPLKKWFFAFFYQVNLTGSGIFK